MIAILGRMNADDANALLRGRRSRAQGWLVLDVDSFADQPAGAQVRAQHELGMSILQDNQWQVTRGEAWHRRSRGLVAPRPIGVGRLMQASDRMGIAVISRCCWRPFRSTH